jgi:hypothetical protein
VRSLHEAIAGSWLLIHEGGHVPTTTRDGKIRRVVRRFLQECSKELTDLGQVALLSVILPNAQESTSSERQWRDAKCVASGHFRAEMRLALGVLTRFPSVTCSIDNSDIYPI